MSFDQHSYWATLNRSHLDHRLFGDWNGDQPRGSVTWRVLLDGTTHVPVRRRVTLLRLADMRSIETKWSDAETGKVVFRGLPLSGLYVAVAWDHTGQFEMLAGGPKPALPES